MKKGHYILLAVILVIIIAVSWFVGKYNLIQKQKPLVEEAWAQVENVYQSRLDLIPNLVATVKGAANFEKETLIGVTEARSKVAGNPTLDPDMLGDPDAFAQFQANQAGLSGALSRLMVVVESYPDIKANQNFLQLQAQLEGVENRIRTERMRYNEEARNFNQLIIVFPNNMIANMIGARSFQYFAAEEGAQKAPEISFE
ncbi:MAG TPA: LemA family protein [Candidatus Cloacimonetes bacterium]|nr:LemA family protein [Candidatus Cloacimonadota bacterium]